MVVKESKNWPRQYVRLVTSIGTGKFKMEISWHWKGLTQQTEREVLGRFKAVVLNLDSIEPQGFGESVSGVRRRSSTAKVTLICSKCSLSYVFVFVWNSCFLGFVLWTQWFCVQLMHGSFCALIKYIPMFWRHHILFFQLRRVRWMHGWNLRGSVPPTRLRTTGLRQVERWPRVNRW